MTQRHGGFRAKTRHKLQKHYRNKGKVSITRFLQGFKEGDKVILKAEPAYQNPRFHGKSGVVTGKRGDCYTVSIHDYKKEKIIIVHPVHLKKA